MFLERQTERGEKSVALLIGAGRRHESNLEAVDTGVLVDVDLREDDLLLESEGVVALAVHLLGDAVEVAYTGESHTDELLEEFIHFDVAQGNFGSDGQSDDDNFGSDGQSDDFLNFGSDGQSDGFNFGSGAQSDVHFGSDGSTA